MIFTFFYDRIKHYKPEVITEGETLEECREMLKDALHEMIAAYKQQNKEIPSGRALIE